MSDRCFGFEELDEVLRRGADDSRMRHIEACPRCRSRLALYRSYVALRDEGGGVGDSRDVGEAEAAERLQGFLERNILGSPPKPIAGRSEAGRFPWFGRLLGPLLPPRRLAPVLGFATLLVAGVLFVRTWQPWGEQAVVLREADDLSISHDIALSPPIWRDPGRLELRWRSFPGAEVYRVRLMSSRFVQLAVFDAGPDTLLSLTAEEILQPPGMPPASFWSVEGYSFGDRIAESAPSVLIPPSP